MPQQFARVFHGDALRTGYTRGHHHAIEKTFRYFDKDSSGFLTAEELRKALAQLGMNLSEKRTQQMIAEITGDTEDTDVDYEEFVGFLKEQCK